MDLPTLTHPERLLWLLGLLLLWWRARPHRPRLALATPHLRQWVAARARVRRRRVRWPWLRLLLLMLAFASVVLAFCGPTLGYRRGPTALAVLLDGTASMAAGERGESPTAWDRAKSTLRAGLRGLPPHVEVRLALCGATVEVHAGTPEEVLTSLDAVLPETPSGTAALDLAVVAERLAAERDRLATWTLTDGLGPARVPEGGAFTRVGEPRDNIGFTAFAVDDGWPLAEVKVEIELESFASSAIDVVVAVEGGVEPRRLEPRNLDPGARLRETLVLRRAAGGPVRIHLADHVDGLALDDAVRCELPPAPAPDIAVHRSREPGDGLDWIGLAAEALAQETGGRVVEGREAERAGFLLVEGGSMPQRGGTMRFLTFGTRRGTAELGPGDLVAAPAVTDWDRTDPITRGLDLSGLDIRTCLRTDFVGAGKPLVRAEHGPLVVVDEGESATSVHAAFRLADSNFALLGAFPQFVRRCFARSFRDKAEPALSPQNLVDRAESRLRPAAGTALPADRPLPRFGAPGRSLAVPLLLLALALLALRVHA